MSRDANLKRAGGEWGLYVHIPFCPTRCVYCDFYSQSDLSLQALYIDALRQELSLYREQEIWSRSPRTIYFGGGTPSSVSLPLLERLMVHIRSLWDLDTTQEITIEANPEDVSEVWTDGVMRLGFNRVSLGVQSWSDDTLRFLRRRHTAEQAKLAIYRIRQVGISNISIDLIFGLPEGYDQEWSETLAYALTLPITHLSAYGLTYEPDTPLDRMKQVGTVIPSCEETYVAQYYDLVSACQAVELTHYELSNWALPGFESQHNSAYWQGVSYLGVGPSAHSYTGVHRWCNVSDIHRYISAIDRGESPIADEEWLSSIELYEEAVMLGLRTRRGIDLHQALLRDTPLLERAEPLLQRGLLEHTSDHYLRLSHQGLVWCDRICAELC